MDRLVQLDKLQVTVIVDNETDGLSPPCGCCDPSAAAADRAARYTSEVSHLASSVKGGSAECLDWSNICFAGHGYSLLLEAEADGRCHRCVKL
jgi:7,8-dihydropterin-6-yl-methyl-4-(beta-D-ribofuranosyl)aminobenzene 5'-phosphate synthase